MQERIFLHLLDDADETRLAKSILKSPLGLSRDIIVLLFEERFSELIKELDSIKAFVAGIHRATTLSANYALASNYARLFSFQQFFHSSYRARQGKVLEETLKSVLRQHRLFECVPDRVQEMHRILSRVFETSAPNLDIDVMGERSDRLLLVQLRSRDDTGGTTAKGSLVDLLRELLRTKKPATKPMLYLVAIWDERAAQQRQSTISKMYGSLKGLIETSESIFAEKISDGVLIAQNIALKLAYGKEQMMRAIIEFASADSTALDAMEKTIRLIERWDDLWLSYSVASIETNSFSGFSNVALLNQKIEALKPDLDFSKYATLVKQIDELTHKLALNWKEPSLPFVSPADSMLYIRDLLFLKACYRKIKQE